MMRYGMMFKSGDVILTQIQFIDTHELKSRPALVLYEEFDNVVVAGITSNTNMKGIFLKAGNGLIRDSVIKLNYIFTVSSSMIKKKISSLSSAKRKEVHGALQEKISGILI